MSKRVYWQLLGCKLINEVEVKKNVTDGLFARRIISCTLQDAARANRVSLHAVYAFPLGIPYLSTTFLCRAETILVRVDTAFTREVSVFCLRLRLASLAWTSCRS
eukprot:750357-Hanusia_phi.AAC.2